MFSAFFCLFISNESKRIQKSNVVIPSDAGIGCGRVGRGHGEWVGGWVGLSTVVGRYNLLGGGGQVNERFGGQ